MKKVEKSARLLLYSINTLTRQRDDACAPETAVLIAGMLSMCANGQYGDNAIMCPMQWVVHLDLLGV